MVIIKYLCKTRGGALLLAAISVFSIPHPAFGSGGITARAGAQYSDNITLVEDNPESDVVRIGALGVWFDHSSPLWNAKVNGELEYRDYKENFFTDETLGSLDAVGNVVLDPQTVVWNAEDYFRQAAVDPLARPIPSNRQNVNIFTTGPEATWRLAPVHSITVGARYSDYYFSKTITDSIRQSAYAAWNYDVSPITNLSLNGEAVNVQYANQTLNDDYRRGDLYLRLTRELPTAHLELDGGVTRIDRHSFENLSGYLARLSWDYHMNSRSDLSAYGMAQYTDSGHDIFSTASRGAAIGLLNEQITGDIYFQKEADIIYRRHGGIIDFDIDGYWRDRNYETSPNDMTRRQATTRFTYYFTRLTSTRLLARYRTDDYTQFDRTDDDSLVALLLAHRLNRSFYINFEVSRRERNSTMPGESFVENRGLVSLSYEPPTTGGRFTPPQIYE